MSNNSFQLKNMFHIRCITVKVDMDIFYSGDQEGLAFVEQVKVKATHPESADT